MESVPDDDKRGPSGFVSLTSRVAITVALLATFLGVCKVKDDNIVQAMQQAQADRLDHWNFYQARNIRQDVAAAEATQLRLSAAAAPAAVQEEYRKRHCDRRVARSRGGGEEGRAAHAGRAGSADLRRAELPRRPVRSVRRADGACDFADGGDRAHPQGVAVLTGARAHRRRRGDGNGRTVRVAHSPGHVRPVPVVARRPATGGCRQLIVSRWRESNTKC